MTNYFKYNYKIRFLCKYILESTSNKKEKWERNQSDRIDKYHEETEKHSV